MDKNSKTKNKERKSSNSPMATTRSSELAEEVKNLKIVVEKLVDENKDLKQQVSELLKPIEFISAKFDENNSLYNKVLDELTEIKNQNKKLMERNDMLEKEILTQKKERIEMEERFYRIITPIEIERRQNNLEIHGVPENEEEEDCCAVVKSVLSKVTAESVAISKCFRFGSKRTQTGEKATRRILVQFENKQHRDIVIKSRANLRKFKDPIYINENLPSHLTILRGKANSLRKQHDYKYLWTSNSNILIRKRDGSQVINIRTPSDLEKII